MSSSMRSVVRTHLIVHQKCTWRWMHGWHRRITLLTLRRLRTTRMLDDDVAAQLERMRAQRGRSFKQLVNDALRAGLVALDAPTPPRSGPYTQPVDLGRPRLLDLDDVSDALAEGEGEGEGEGHP
jgi:hypothetical protein